MPRLDDHKINTTHFDVNNQVQTVHLKTMRLRVKQEILLKDLTVHVIAEFNVIAENNNPFVYRRQGKLHLCLTQDNCKMLSCLAD